MKKKGRGLTSSKRHCKKCHRRWLAIQNSKYVKKKKLDISCVTCQFFILTCGAFEEILWGVCSCANSKWDGLACYQYNGCSYHKKQNSEDELYYNEDHVDETHCRWSERRNKYGDSSIEQCGFCRYFICLEGKFIEDWGICSNRLSYRDGMAQFEHDGCEYIEINVLGFGGVCPRIHIEREKKRKGK